MAFSALGMNCVMRFLTTLTCSMPHSTAARKLSISRSGLRAFFLLIAARSIRGSKTNARPRPKPGDAASPFKRPRQCCFDFCLFFAPGALIGAELAHLLVHSLFELFALLFLALERFSEPALHDNAGCLSRDRREQTDFIARKMPATRCLHHQNSQGEPALDQRHAEKRMEMLFMGFRKI